MKLAVFTDLHLGIKQDDSSWHEVALNWCDSMANTLKERGSNGLKQQCFIVFHDSADCIDKLRPKN